MRSEVGTDLARQFKARMLAEQSAADSMLRKRILADEVRRENVSLLLAELKSIVSTFNAETDRTSHLKLSTHHEQILVKKDNRDLVFLRVDHGEVSYRGPAQNQQPIRYRFMIEIDAHGTRTFHPENSAQRMTLHGFLFAVLEHALGLRG
jgi:hypothetical protein